MALVPPLVYAAVAAVCLVVAVAAPVWARFGRMERGTSVLVAGGAVCWSGYFVARASEGSLVPDGLATPALVYGLLAVAVVFGYRYRTMVREV